MEQTLTSPFTAYYDVEPPAAARPDKGRRKKWPVVIGTHGYEGNKESMMRLILRITAGRMVAASLQGPHQFWLPDRPATGAGEASALASGAGAGRRRVGFGWGTNYRGQDSVAFHHHALQQVIATLVRDHHADPERVFLVAFSQSCSDNYRFAFSHPGMVRGVVAVCGGIPGDWKENPAYQKGAAHVLHIAATEDHWYSAAKNQQFRADLPLLAASVAFRFYHSPHRFPRTAIPNIRRWIEKIAA
jgi:predicted esterase